MVEISPSVCLIGAGAIAHALAHGLKGAGWEVRAWSRQPDRAPAPWIELGELADQPLAVICVTDGAIAEVAERLSAAAGRRSRPGVVLHTSGYHDSGLLAPLAADGWSTGSLHPLCAVPPIRVPAESTSRTVAGAWFACEGNELALAACARILKSLDGQRFPLPAGPGGKARYHAAATLAAAGSVALLDAASTLISGTDASVSDTDRALCRQAFADLCRSALENATAAEPSAALTGPLARGDAAVVAAHLELLRSLEGAPTDLYLEVARYALTLTRRRGALGADALARLDDVVD